MKRLDVLDLTPGTLVQVRLTGPGARRPSEIDYVEVAEVVSVDVAGAFGQAEFDGVVVDGVVRRDPGVGSGYHLVVRSIAVLHEGSDDETPSPADRSLRLIQGLDVVAVWTQERAERVLTDRRERRAKNAATRARHVEQVRARRAQKRETRDEIVAIVGAENLPAFVQADPPSAHGSITLDGLAAVVRAAYAAGQRDAGA